MNFRRIKITSTFVALVIVLVTLGLSGCEEHPSEPNFDNPFDPAGPSGGDAMQVSAIIIESSYPDITISWRQPQGHNISTYSILLRKGETGAFNSIGSKDHTSSSSSSYNYTGAAPTTTHYFQIQAITSDGNAAFISNQVPAVLVTAPLVELTDGNKIATRLAEFNITVTTWDSLRVATNDTFGDALVVEAASDGTPLRFNGIANPNTFDLGSATENEEEKHLYVQAFTGTVESEITHLILETKFAPAFTAAGNPTSQVRRIIDLDIPIAGVIRMDFVDSLANLDTDFWLEPSPTYAGYELKDVLENQVIYGWFLSDFGYSNIVEYIAKPDPLTDIEFTLVIPEDSIVDVDTIDIVSSAGASLMRFSESPNFIAVPWVAYADTSTFMLSDGAGTKTIYAQYRNDWTDSAILSDYVIYVAQPVAVRFLAPADGDLLIGGTSLQILGTTNGDSLALDLGDGLGFIPVPNEANWDYTWDIPKFIGDTDVVIRARGWADGDSITTNLNLTITSLYVRINQPVNGARIPEGTEIEISLEASGITGGAPVDSVFIHVGDESTTFTNLSELTMNWTTPEVTEDTEMAIIAAVFAAEEVASTMVRFIVVTQVDGP